MNWTMPRPVLQAVAGVLVLGAMGAFAMGIINAPEHGGRLPGARAPGQPAGPATEINAADATPITQERIEGPPPAAPKAANTTDDQEADSGDEATNTLPVPPIKSAEAAKPAAATNATAPQDRVGDLLQPAAPTPEEPPH